MLRDESPRSSCDVLGVDAGGGEGSSGLPELGISLTASATMRGRSSRSANTLPTASPSPPSGPVVLRGHEPAAGCPSAATKSVSASSD